MPAPQLTFGGRRWIGRLMWLCLLVAGWWWRDDLVRIATVEDTSATSLLVFGGVYVVLAGLAVPGAVALSVLAGALFGLAWGTAVASVASNIGASIAFVASRHMIWGPPPAEDERRALQMGIRELALLRLTPVVPFFLVNVMAGRSTLSLGQFWLVSQVTMLPATLLLVSVGAELQEVFPALDSPAAALRALWPLAILAVLATLLYRWYRNRTRVVCP